MFAEVAYVLIQYKYEGTHVQKPIHTCTYTNHKKEESAVFRV